MLSMRHVERLTGVLLLVGVVSFLTHFVTFSVLRNDVATIALILVYGVFVLLSAVGMYLTFRPHEPTLSLFGALGFAVHGLFIVLIGAILLAGLRLPEEFPTTFGNDDGAMVAALELATAKIRTSAFVISSIGLLALGILILWSAAVPRWMGWMAATGGVVGFPSMLAALIGVDPLGVNSIVMIIAFLTGLAFMLALGTRLVGWRTREATSADAWRIERMLAGERQVVPG